MERTHRYFCHLSPLHSTATSRREFPDSPVERLVKKLWIHLLQIWASLWRPCSTLKLKEQVFFHKVWLSFCQPSKCPEKISSKSACLVGDVVDTSASKKNTFVDGDSHNNKKLCKAYSPILNLPLSHNVFCHDIISEKKKKTNFKSFSPSPYTQSVWVNLPVTRGGKWFHDLKVQIDSLKGNGNMGIKNNML